MQFSINPAKLKKPKSIYLATFYIVIILYLVTRFWILFYESETGFGQQVSVTTNYLYAALAGLHLVLTILIPHDSKRVLAHTLMAIIGALYLLLIFISVAFAYFVKSGNIGFYSIAFLICTVFTTTYSIKQTKKRLIASKFVFKEYQEHETHFEIKQASIPKYHKPLKNEKGYFNKIGVWLMTPVIFVAPFIEPINRILIRDGNISTPFLFLSVIVTPLIIAMISGFSKHFYTTVWIPFSIERKTEKKVYFEEI